MFWVFIIFLCTSKDCSYGLPGSRLFETELQCRGFRVQMLEKQIRLGTKDVLLRECEKIKIYF